MKNRRHVVRSKIEQMPAEQREKIHAWLREGLSYATVATRIYGAFGVKTSDTAVCTYYQRHFLQAELRETAKASETEAAGVEILIRFPAPGRLVVQVRPIS